MYKKLRVSLSIKPYFDTIQIKSEIHRIRLHIDRLFLLTYLPLAKWLVIS